jgi:hypothetical protein
LVGNLGRGLGGRASVGAPLVGEPWWVSWWGPWWEGLGTWGWWEGLGGRPGGGLGGRALLGLVLGGRLDGGSWWRGWAESEVGGGTASGVGWRASGGGNKGHRVGDGVVGLMLLSAADNFRGHARSPNRGRMHLPPPPDLLGPVHEMRTRELRRPASGTKLTKSRSNRGTCGCGNRDANIAHLPKCSFYVRWMEVNPLKQRAGKPASADSQVPR